VPRSGEGRGLLPDRIFQSPPLAPVTFGTGPNTSLPQGPSHCSHGTNTRPKAPGCPLPTEGRWGTRMEEGPCHSLTAGTKEET
jgi:hypothetical protein